VAHRTLCNLGLLGFAVGLVGVLPDLDHWYALVRGWPNTRFAHNPLVFVAYALLWSLGILTLSLRWGIVDDLSSPEFPLYVRSVFLGIGKILRTPILQNQAGSLPAKTIGSIFRLKLYGRDRLAISAKLFGFSLVYGLLSINYIDLIVPGSEVPGYHLWLVVSYFAPFIPLLLMLGLDNWELVGSLGLTTSLMNDLFYYPVGMLIFKRSVNLQEWYSFQLGLRGLAVRWSFNAGLFKIPISSLLMASTIYLRIAVGAVLFYRWWSHRGVRLNPATAHGSDPYSPQIPGPSPITIPYSVERGDVSRLNRLRIDRNCQTCAITFVASPAGVPPSARSPCSWGASRRDPLWSGRWSPSSLD